ncbi:MAG: hypothetical protein WAK57_00885 [Desulfobacterales bacterium]
MPLNVQRLCHTLWEKARESKKVTSSLVEELPFAIAKQDSPHFELLWHSASPQQKNLLMALSKEPNAKPFSKDFQLTYGIGPSSSIKASLESLVKKGILFRGKDGSYQFSDVFMVYWVQFMTQPDLWSSVWGFLATSLGQVFHRMVKIDHFGMGGSPC